MEERNKIYTAMEFGRIYNDYELASLTGYPLDNVRYHIGRLKLGGLVDDATKVKIGRKVYHGYVSRQMSLLKC